MLQNTIIQGTQVKALLERIQPNKRDLFPSDSSTETKETSEKSA